MPRPKPSLSPWLVLEVAKTPGRRTLIAMQKILDNLYVVALLLGFAAGLMFQLIVTGNGF